MALHYQKNSSPLSTRGSLTTIVTLLCLLFPHEKDSSPVSLELVGEEGSSSWFRDSSRHHRRKLDGGTTRNRLSEADSSVINYSCGALSGSTAPILVSAATVSFPDGSTMSKADPLQTPYVFSYDRHTKMKFSQHVAAGACSRGSYLGVAGWMATPTTEEEATLVRGAAPARSVILGGYCDRSENSGEPWHWRWKVGPLGDLEGGNGVTFFKQWRSGGQRECAAGYVCDWDGREPGSNENLVIGGDGWHDWPGSSSFPAVCQYTRKAKRYFLLMRGGRFNYDASKQQCERQAARLPHIYSPDDLTRLQFEIFFPAPQGSNSFVFYVALQFDDTTDAWYWPDADPSTGKQLFSRGRTSSDCSSSEMSWCRWRAGDQRGSAASPQNKALYAQTPTGSWEEGLRDGPPTYETQYVVCESNATDSDPSFEPTMSQFHNSSSESLSHLSPSDTSTPTHSSTLTESRSVSSTPSVNLTSSTSFAVTKKTVSPSRVRTPAPIPTSTQRISPSKNTLTVTNEIPRTRTPTLIVPTIRVLYPAARASSLSENGVVYPLSERGFSKLEGNRGRSRVRIDLLLEDAVWDCDRISSKIFRSPTEIFKRRPTPSGGSLHPAGTPRGNVSTNDNETLGENQHTTTDQEVGQDQSSSTFFSRIGILASGEYVSCLPGTGGSVVRFTFRQDKGFRIAREENFTIEIFPYQDSKFFPDPTPGSADNAAWGGWIKDTDSLQLERSANFSQTFVIVDDRPPSPITIPKAVVESAEATAGVSTVIASAAGNPAMAVQGARTGLILALVECEDGTDEDLDFLTHPVGLPLGDGITQYWAGACLWNPIVVLGTTLFHYGLVLLYSFSRKVPIQEATGLFFFPAFQAMIILPLSQPTVSAVTVVLKQSNENAQIGAALFASILLLALLGFVLWKTTKWGFFGEFVHFPTKKGTPGHRHWLYVFLTGPGEYIDKNSLGKKKKKKEKSLRKKKNPGAKTSVANEDDVISELLEEGLLEEEVGSIVNTAETASLKSANKPHVGSSTKREEEQEVAYQRGDYTVFWVKRYFLFFDLYKPSRIWFGAWELILTYVFGIIEGLHPSERDHCKTVSLITSLLFVVIFLVILKLRPYISLFEMGSGFLIVGGQMLSSLSTTIYMLQDVKPAIDVGSWTAVGGMYMLAVKATVDLLIVAYDLAVEYCCSGSQKKIDRLDEDDGQPSTTGEKHHRASSEERGGKEDDDIIDVFKGKSGLTNKVLEVPEASLQMTSDSEIPTEKSMLQSAKNPLTQGSRFLPRTVDPPPGPPPLPPPPRKFPVPPPKRSNIQMVDMKDKFRVVSSDGSMMMGKKEKGKERTLGNLLL